MNWLPIGTQISTTQAIAVSWGLGLLALLVGIWAFIRARAAARPAEKRRMPSEAPSEDVVERLRQYEELVEAQRQTMDLLQSRLAAVEQASRSGVSRVGLKRFNAFDDTGAELSFSLALLNDGGNGAVLTGLWGRDESRLFAKPVSERASRYPLSDEELTAIDLAMRDRNRVPVHAP